MKRLNIFIVLTIVCVIACLAGPTVWYATTQTRINEEQNNKIDSLTTKLEKIDENSAKNLNYTKDTLIGAIFSLNETLTNNFNNRFAKEIHEFGNQIEALRNELIFAVNDSTKNLNLRIADATTKLHNTCTRLADKVDIQSNELGKIHTTVVRNKSALDVEIDQLWLAIAPVGAIMPFIGSKAPQNWVICDGLKINDLQSDYNDQKAPDLQGLFIRGLDKGQIAGKIYGTDTIGPHRHGIPAHSHSVEGQEVSFITNGHNNIGSCYCENGMAFQCSDISRPDACKLNLMGVINKNDDYSYSGKIKIPDRKTDSKSLTSYSSGGHSNVPRYAAYNYIMRIK